MNEIRLILLLFAMVSLILVGIDSSCRSFLALIIAAYFGGVLD